MSSCESVRILPRAQDCYLLEFSVCKDFFIHYTLVFQSEVKCVYFYHALFVFCFGFTFFKHSKKISVTRKAYAIHNKFTTFYVVYYRR